MRTMEEIGAVREMAQGNEVVIEIVIEKKGEDLNQDPDPGNKFSYGSTSNS